LFIVVLASWLLPHKIIAQDDFSWWNEANNWDGHTHWTKYIIYSPYYMGPNSLTIPDSQNGIIKETVEFDIDFVNHWGKGDKVQNFYLSLYLPVVKDLIAVEFSGVPFEQYNMTSELILERRTRNIDGKGTAIGDFYFSTMIQLLKDKKFPDVVFRMACRTASGNSLADARYTDSPGYFFDASIGKDFLPKDCKLGLRCNGMIGFYSWQMDLPNNRQNDAILYGIGADLTYNSWFLSNNIKGYYGYLGNSNLIVGNPDQLVVFRDRPTIFKTELGKLLGNTKFSVSFGKAVHDFYYDSLTISCKIII